MKENDSGPHLHAGMDELRREIGALAARLEALGAEPGSIEGRVLQYLRRLAADAETAASAGALNAPFAELNSFWRETVPWCSELSRDIEKLIILHADLL